MEPSAPGAAASATKQPAGTTGACKKSTGILNPHGMAGSVKRPEAKCPRQWTCRDDFAVKDLLHPGKRHLKGLSRVLRCRVKEGKRRRQRLERKDASTREENNEWNLE